jgi:CheY-like chemotaxis protein
MNMSSGSTSPSSGKVVIGVDDAPENLALLQSVTKAGGFSFVGMKGGEECLSVIHKIIPRLILLDIQMPGLNGFETCRRLRNIPELRGVPIAFLTAQKTPEDVQTCLKVGGNDFIAKPFDPVKLLERIKYWTARRL